MPTTVQRHLCNICHKEFIDYAEACACEGMGLPPEEWLPGSELMYNDESTMFGSRWTYSTESGIVLGSLVFRSTDESSGRAQHKRGYFVQRRGMFAGEALVMLVNGEFGLQWFSSADWKYCAGYFSSLPQFPV